MLEHNPLVSVIMPTYNRAHCVKKAIDSVLAQTYRNLELVVVDDGSTDDTKQVVMAIPDERIVYVRCEQNRHICNALNLGIEKARGAYIARIDSDDSWNETKLMKQVAYMEEHPQTGACFTYARIVSDRQVPWLSEMFHRSFETQEEWIRYFFVTGNTLCHPSVLMRKSVLMQVGPYRLPYVQLQDFELWIRMTAAAPIYVYPEELVDYTWAENQISSPDPRYGERLWNEFLMIREDFFEKLPAEMFLRCFGKEFRDPDSHTPTELACEQAFLQMKYPFQNHSVSYLGVKRLKAVLEMPDGQKVLEERFGYTTKDFYEDNTHQCFYSRMRAEEIAQLRETEQSDAWRRFLKLNRLFERLKGRK